MKNNFLFGLIAVLIWSTMAPLVKVMLYNIPNLQALSISSFIGFAFLLIINIINGKIKQFKTYSIKFFSESSFMMTVAIVSGSNFRELDDCYLPVGRPKNRSIAVEFNNISFLGIHAETEEKNKPFLESINGKADVILGDFNAGNYLESENRAIFNKILTGHVCICNMPTKITESGRRTCIDHVFVKEDIITRCSKLIVHEEIKLSDHFPITFEID